MVSSSTIRSTERSLSLRDRSIEHPRSPQTAHVEHGAAGFSLPSHLLVSLAGITAGYLVDGSYQWATQPTAPGMQRADLPQLHRPKSAQRCRSASPNRTASRAQPPGRTPAPSPLLIERHHDHGRRRPWASASEHSS